MKQSSQCGIFSLKNKKKTIKGYNEIQTHDPVDTGAMLYQLSYEATQSGASVLIVFWNLSM